MKLQDMFSKDINRSINGVIKVMQTDDENRRQELEEYVITRELQKHFGAFYDHYEQGIDGPTDKIGVWISGFFGSGKSHFLKILSYLLANEEVCGKRALDYFEEKFDYDPLRYAMMRRVGETPTEVILFNIDAKSPMGKDQDSILRVFTKVFYEHCGYYGDDMKVAALERFLDRQGKLEAFKQAFQEINTEPWETAREAFAFWGDDVVAALEQTAGLSEQAARNWFNGEETAQLSIDRLTREISEYVESKGKNFHLVFLVDEIGQYIGDNSGLMLNLQTIVEELGSKCRGKVWVIVTSQEDIDSVTHVKGNDFSKIQGRFNTRLSLSSASVDEVIKRRILAKTPAAETLLRLLYQQNSSIMRNLFSFAPGTIADLKGYGDETEFVETYPFVPYQFKLLQEVLAQVRKHGSSGKHLSGGERSMLSAFQEAAQQVQTRDETCFVPFYAFYDTIHTFLDGAIRRVIDRAHRAAQAGDGLKPQDVDVLKLLFLIRYVDGVPANLENLSTLMIGDIHADKILLRRSLRESLDRLARENYVSRNGETYLFLTDEEQDVNREIRTLLVEPSEVTHIIGQAAFAELYPVKKFRYKNRYDFPFDQMVDGAVIGQPSSDMKLKLITLASASREEEADAQWLLQSRADDAVIVLLNAESDYYQEFEEARRIEKYIKQRNIAQLTESIRQIVQGKQAEAKEREKTAANLLKDAILRGTFFISGERVQIRASSVKDALDQALTRLVEDVYSKLNYVSSFVQSDQDILQILSGQAVQETMPGMPAPNALALEEMRQYLEIRARQHRTVTMAEMQKRYQSAPYGWREIDIAALTAHLLSGHRIQLLYAGAPLAANDRRTPDCLRKRTETEKTVVRQKVSAPEALLKQARRQAAELFNSMDLATEEEAFCGQLEALLSQAQQKNNSLLARYSPEIPYPGKAVVEKGKAALAEALIGRGDNVAFLQAFTAAEDALLDWAEDVGEVEFFFQSQRAIFDDAWKLQEQFHREIVYFADEPEALTAEKQLSEILKSPKPYRDIAKLPTLKQTISAAYDRINAARREQVRENLILARGDIHSLAGDDPRLRDEIRKIDAELDRRQESALRAASPVELDAAITQILAYKDNVCRKLEQMLAQKSAPDQPGPDKPKLRVVTLRRYDALPQKRLSSPEEIDAYVNQLRALLLEQLRSCDAIQMN